MKRRSFIQAIASTFPAKVLSRVMSAQSLSAASFPDGNYQAGRILNEYTALLPGEKELLGEMIEVRGINSELQAVDVSLPEKRTLSVGHSVHGWKLLAILPWHNGAPTAVLEKHVTHRGALAFVSADRELARIPKYVGNLRKIRPRQTDTPHGIKFERPAKFVPGPDKLGEYILQSSEDPCFENVAALGREYTGWTLISDDGVGGMKSLWLEPDGKTRQFGADPENLWAPDVNGRLFEPSRLLPRPYLYAYVPGYSKRTMLGGYLPAADIGVWNPETALGYEVMMVLSGAGERKPIARVRAILPTDQSAAFREFSDVTAPSIADGEMDRYWNGTAAEFYDALLGLWQRWNNFFDEGMQVEIPDEWLSNTAKAGIVLSRCSYRGLEPSYQIGEGGYTKIPERSHALFPVAHYEFVWAQQLWNLAARVEPHFQHYLTQYILPDGNFLYCTQEQVEAPLNTGVFLQNSARAYDYTGDTAALRARLPVLRKMIGFVMKRYEYAKARFPQHDPRHGLIWGSPEADNGSTSDDTPDSHPYYYQNAAWIWRGLKEYGRCLQRAGKNDADPELAAEGRQISEVAQQLRTEIERSLQFTLQSRNAEMKRAGITPFAAFDINRKPSQVSSYENHRYMMDWWTADWGNPELDEGHLQHRVMAGLEVLGMNVARDEVYGADSGSLLTANFMEHGTLAVRIRKEDYRRFLLTLYSNLCYAMDAGNSFAPEDALLPGGYAGEGVAWNWSPVVNSVLQPSMGLRWLLCWEESDRDIIHLQKAAPKHWFQNGRRIAVRNCPTRFGIISWSTECQVIRGASKWNITLQLSPSAAFQADVVVHIHPADDQPLRTTNLGQIEKNSIVIPAASLVGKSEIYLQVSS
jgi:hypothetical protein